MSQATPPSAKPLGRSSTASGRTVSVSGLFALVLNLAAVIGPAHGQDEPMEGWRAPPPANAIVRMRQSVNAGADRGHRVKLKGVEITDSRFNPFLIQVTISGDRGLGIYKARFVTEQGEFSTQLPKDSNARWNGGLAFAPGGADSQFSTKQTEERTFNIDLEDAILLVESETLEFTLTGRLQERSYKLKSKQFESLKKWFAPRVALHRSKHSPKRKDQP